MYYYASTIILIVFLCVGVIGSVVEHKLLEKRKDYVAQISFETRLDNGIIDHNQRFSNIEPEELWQRCSEGCIEKVMFECIREKRDYGKI